MEKNSSFVEPYKPSRIHKFFDWIDRLPGPYWLFYLGLVVTAGLLNHIVAWNENLVAPGEINWYYALTTFFLAFFLFTIDFLIRVTQDTIVEFLPVLDVSEGERDRILFEFTHLPARPTTLIFWIASSVGLGMALSIFPTALEMNNAFPELEIPVFTFSVGMSFIMIYMAIRAYILTNRVYRILRTINIYDLNSLYAMSRYPAWLLVIIISGLYLFFALNPSFINFTYPFYLFLATFWVVITFLIFWFPVRRVNRMLILEKRRLLTDVNLHIETTFDLLHARIDQQEFKHIAEIREAIQSLMIEKEFTSSLRTWPWQPGTFRGLLTLLLAPLILDLFVMILSKFITF